MSRSRANVGRSPRSRAKAPLRRTASPGRERTFAADNRTSGRARRDAWLILAVAATLAPWCGLSAQDNALTASAYRERGFQYLKDGSPQAALGQFYAAIEADPGDSESHLAIGIVQAERSRHGDALAHFEDAIAIDPDFSQAHFHRAMALDRTGGRTTPSTRTTRHCGPNPIPCRLATC